jgi:hypothetical protein
MSRRFLAWWVSSTIEVSSRTGKIAFRSFTASVRDSRSRSPTTEKAIHQSCDVFAMRFRHAPRIRSSSLPSGLSDLRNLLAKRLSQTGLVLPEDDGDVLSVERQIRSLLGGHDAGYSLTLGISQLVVDVDALLA